MHHKAMRFWWSHGHPNCGPDGGGWAGRRHARGRGGGPGFGVRRPLRFLARHLDLDDRQIADLAVVISELKTERAQAEVDDRRALARYADAVGSAELDAEALAEAQTLRRGAVERVEGAVAAALERMHEILDPEQRDDLAMLIRTGGLRL